MASARFVFLDADSLLDGLRRADHLVARVPGAASVKDLRLHMKPFTTRVSGDASRCRHAIFQKTTPVLAHALSLSGWTMAERLKSQHSLMQKAEALLLREDEEEDAPGETNTLVVVVGDSCEDLAKGRFRGIVERFLSHGEQRWRVEILTWTHSLAPEFRQLAQDHPHAVSLHLLDGEDADLLEIVYSAAPTTPTTPLKAKPPVIVTKSASTGGSPQKKPSPANLKSRKHGIVMPWLIQSRLNRIYKLRQRDVADMYSASGRLRYIVMDADNIFLSVRNASHLLPLVDSAAASTDLRMNFKALTNRVCNSAIGFKDDLVRELKAMHYVTPTWLVKGLLQCRWTVEKQRNVMDACLHEELRRLLLEAQEDDDEDEESDGSEDVDEEPTKRTLVLVTGDGNEDEAATSASFRGIVDEFLAAGWSVEIHAWTHALHTTYIDLMEARPQDVLVRPLDSDFGDDHWDEEATKSGSIVSAKLVFASPNESNADAVSPAVYRPPPMRPPVMTAQPAVVLASHQAPEASPPPPEAETPPVETVETLARIRQLEAELARVTRDKQALAMQMQLMVTAHETRVQQLSRERWDGFGACLRAITCPVSGQVLQDPVLLACCRVTMSKAAAQELRDREEGCPQCHVVAFKMLSVPAMDEVVRAVMDHVPS